MAKISSHSLVLFAEVMCTSSFWSVWVSSFFHSSSLYCSSSLPPSLCYSGYRSGNAISDRIISFFPPLYPLLLRIASFSFSLLLCVRRTALRRRRRKEERKERVGRSPEFLKLQ